VLKVDDGCSASAFDTIRVEVEPLPDPDFDAGENTIVCARKPFNLSNLSHYRDGSAFLWNFGDGDTAMSREPEHSYEKEGRYPVMLQVISKLGCTDSLLKDSYILVNPTPVVSFTTDVQETDVFDAKVNFSPSKQEGVNSYHWTFGDDKGYSADSNPVYYYDHPGTYKVTLAITNSLGCSDLFTRDFPVSEIYTLYVPNVFTPNGDGLNDLFKPVGRGIASYDLKVVSRLGDILFTSNDPSAGWDGKDKKGGWAPSDSYWCYVTTKDFLGRSFTHRSVFTLLR
jgi:gliding motility-associated-like protein